ncbi:MAG: hypothetical protein EHM23_03505 [Acidobacteria bacterium]|nr:MAG: hypothetical protein EHM23_03505 [Acidobacteriota bacterium]
MRRVFVLHAVVGCLLVSGFASVFPPPQQMQVTKEKFGLADWFIAVPPKASSQDMFLARSFSAFLVDRWQLALPVREISKLPSGRPVIVMGTGQNALVRQALERGKMDVSTRAGGPEGYVLDVQKDLILIAGGDDAGTFYGLQSLRQLVGRTSDQVQVTQASIQDWPYKPFRGVKVYLPGRDNLPFFKRFLSEFVALYKFNKLILEMNAGMRLDRHPEVNAGWIELANDLNYSRRHRPEGPNGEFTDSVHHDTADGRMLEKAEVADLVAFAAQHHVEVIPEIPALTHCYYLLTRHRELAEIQNAEWPDTYCPSNPASYELLFDVVDEYLEVIKPRMVHMGHDEWRMPVGVCPACRGKDPRDLFIADLKKIHGHLTGKGVRLAIWGDHLNERVRGVKTQAKKLDSGFEYETPGGLTSEQVKTHVPKDILIFNWLWEDMHGGAKNDNELSEWGFEHIYGNFTEKFVNYAERSKLKGLIGGAPSAWAVSSELSIGKDRLHNFLGTSGLLWSTQWPELSDLYRNIQALMPEVRRNLRGRSSPSQDGDPVVPVPLPTGGTACIKPPVAVRSGRIEVEGKAFDLSSSLITSSATDAPVIPIGEDFSSLIFLHGLANEADNNVVDRLIYNVDDTSDLLGYYEVLYEDNLKVTVPVRYRVNILQWQWGKNPTNGYYCWGADHVDVSQAGDSSCSFFAYEWVNPRFGKVIKEVRLFPSKGFRDWTGKTIDENSIWLAAISGVKKRPFPDPIKAAAANR